MARDGRSGQRTASRSRTPRPSGAARCTTASSPAPRGGRRPGDAVHAGAESAGAPRPPLPQPRRRRCCRCRRGRAAGTREHSRRAERRRRCSRDRAGRRRNDADRTTPSQRARRPLRQVAGSRSSSGPIPTIWDGRFANNGWLQELPKPLTKVTWDPTAWISPQLAKERGLSDGDLIELKLSRQHRRGCRCSGCPGIPRSRSRCSSATGGSMAGRVGTAARTPRHSTPSCCARPTRRGSAAVSRSPRPATRYLLATTQEHHLMEGRAARPRRDARGVQGRAAHHRRSRARQPPKHADAVSRPRVRRQQVGHGDRPDDVHRLQRLHDRLRRREQHPGRRQGAGRGAAARCTGSASTTTSPATTSTTPRGVPPAGALHAVRERAVRGGLPGRRDDAQRGRPERHGLQPLRRHALLLEQLPVQGAALQLPALPGLDDARASSRCATPTSRCAAAA